MAIRPITVTVVAGTVQTIPVDWRAGDITITADYTAGTNYTVEYTVADIWDSSVTPIWTAVTDMSAATADASKQIQGPVFALRLTHTGTNQTVFQIAQMVS
jgi:hypothetical protein